jgi:hypothetical protein
MLKSPDKEMQLLGISLGLPTMFGIEEYALIMNACNKIDHHRTKVELKRKLQDKHIENLLRKRDLKTQYKNKQNGS